MTFHADFWVVAGTTAPVIALSSVLANGDVFKIYMDLTEITGKTTGSVPFWKWPYNVVGFWYWVAGAVTFLQAFTLFFSLMSLVQGHDYAPTQLIAAGGALSLLILGGTTLI